MKVSLIERAPVTIAYLRHQGPYGQSVSRFWSEVYMPWARLNQLPDDHSRYGIGHDDPSITAPEHCRYDACAEVAHDFVIQGDAIKTTLPSGLYAVHTFYDQVDKLASSWAELLKTWLPGSGYQLDNRPCFEYYRPSANYDKRSGQFECDICIPIMPL